MTPPAPPEIARVIEGYDPDTRAGVVQLRALILNVAAALPDPAPVEEALRWGQPAYLTPKGSTLRIGPHKQASFALFAHCQTTIITSYVTAFPGWDKVDGNRAIPFETPSQIEPERLSHLIRHALTYHAKIPATPT